MLITTTSNIENYENISAILHPINKEIDHLQTNGLAINGKLTKFTFFLGGDYKFLLTACGMNAANSKFACIYCEAEKKDYWRSSGGKRRTDLRVGKCGSVRDNLLDAIPLNNVVIDELHLFLRATDKLFLLIRREISEAQAEGFVEHMRSVISCRGKIVVSNGGVEFSRLDGSDRRRIIRNMTETDVLLTFLGRKRGLQVKCFLGRFMSVLETVHSSSDHDEIRRECETVMKMFLALFQSVMITPYLHILFVHMHEIVRRVGCVSSFQQQSDEKLNHTVTSTFFNATNFKDGPLQIMQRRTRVLKRAFESL